MLYLLVKLNKVMDMLYIFADAVETMLWPR